MRAVVHERYGPPEVQEIREVPRPEPKDDELLVRVRATTVNQTDCHRRAARSRSSGASSTVSCDPSSRSSAPSSPARWRPWVRGDGLRRGDRVFGWRWSAAAHAEYLLHRESRASSSTCPRACAFEEAAAICDGAYQGRSALRAGNVGEGTRLVVYGASGSLGTAAVQLGRHLGAHVTAVCNTKNLELVRSLGADDVDRLPARGLHEERPGVRRRSSTRSASTRTGSAAARSARAASSSRPTGCTTSSLRYWTRWFDSRKVVFRVE